MEGLARYRAPALPLGIYVKNLSMKRLISPRAIVYCIEARLLRQGSRCQVEATRVRMWKLMNYKERIVRDQRVVGGQAVFKGTRVTLRTVLASLAEGATTAEILGDFPTLSEEDVRAAIAFAATSAQEDLPLADLSQ